MRPREGRRTDRAHGAALDHDAVGFGLALGARRDRQARHRADRRQGFAAEAQGGDAQQVEGAILARRQLGGGVALDGQGQLVTRHARAIVGHQDSAQAAAIGLDLEPHRAGVESVLDQLLHGARRALDHLTGGDAVTQARSAL